MSLYEPGQSFEDSDTLDSAPHSDRPSYLPDCIPDDQISDRLKEETRFWTIKQILSIESAEAFLEAEDVRERLYQSGVLEDMGLNPKAPKHKSLGGHGTKVSIFGLLIDDKLKENLSPKAVSDKRVLAVAGMLHDIGKLEPSINEVVMSDSKWGEDALIAWQIIKRHPVIGAEVVYAMPGLRSPEEMINVANAIYQHHENYDGTGYHRISGNNICREGRILRMADAVDAMSEPRTYKEPMSPLNIMRELEKNGRMYDPAMLETIGRIRRISGIFSKVRNIQSS